MLYKCCVCRKFRINGEWVRLRHEDKLHINDQIGAYCPECTKRLIEEIRDALQEERERDRLLFAYR